MRIDSYPLGQLQANCYFLTQGSDCIIIDPADSADFILEKIQRERLNLVALLATHGHFDHIMAVGEIQLSYDVPLYIHDDDLFLVKRLNETAKHFLGFDPAVTAPKETISFKAGSLEIGDFAFNVIHTPGHTPGS
ncbi:MAG: MBL fold metallo-hydrolase, partial [Microgenomates group bacterium]